jgi:hypothetical protein
MQDILRGIENHLVPDDGTTPSSSTRSSPSSSLASEALPVLQRRSSRVEPGSNSGNSLTPGLVIGARSGSGGGSKTSKAESEPRMRRLCEDFTDIPFDTIPHYKYVTQSHHDHVVLLTFLIAILLFPLVYSCIHSSINNLTNIVISKHHLSECVRRLLSMRVIKENLRTHSYRSLSFLAKDFYELLNNARTVTSSDTQTWVDSLALGQLFEELKWQSCQPSAAPLIDGLGTGEGRVTGGRGIRVFTEERRALQSSSSSTPTSTSSSGTRKNTAVSRMTCSACSVQYFVTEWPNKAPMTSTVTASTPSSTASYTSKDVGVEKKGRKSASRDGSSNSLSQTHRKADKRGQSKVHKLSESEESLPYAWALKMIASTSSETFTYPEGTEMGKVKKDRRADKEKKWNKEWNAAVAHLREKEKETKEKEKEMEITLIDATPSASPVPEGTTVFGWMCARCIHPGACPAVPLTASFIPIAPLPQTRVDSSSLPPIPSRSCPLNNRAVLVWWHDDEEFYGGFINAFDSLTGMRYGYCHISIQL